MLDHTLLSNPCLPATELSQHDTSSNARLLAAVPARWPQVAGTLTSPQRFSTDTDPQVLVVAALARRTQQDLLRWNGPCSRTDVGRSPILLKGDNYA